MNQRVRPEQGPDRPAHLNSACGELYRLIAQGGWHAEHDILRALSHIPPDRVRRALQQGVDCGIYRSWIVGGGRIPGTKIWIDDPVQYCVPAKRIAKWIRPQSSSQPSLL